MRSTSELLMRSRPDESLLSSMGSGRERREEGGGGGALDRKGHYVMD